jgi:hypothetical protein
MAYSFRSDTESIEVVSDRRPLMARYRAPKNIEDMRKEGKTKPRSPKVQPNETGFLTAAKKVTGILIAVFGLLAGYTWLSPQIYITANDPLNKDIFSSPFTLTNSSTFPIMNVETSCVVNKAKTERGSTEEGNKSSRYMLPITELESGDMSTTFCKDGLNIGKDDPYVFADVTISAEYRPAWAPFRKRKSVNFIETRDSGGKARWLPKSALSPSVVLKDWSR